MTIRKIQKVTGDYEGCEWNRRNRNDNAFDALTRGPTRLQRIKFTAVVNGIVFIDKSKLRGNRMGNPAKWKSGNYHRDYMVRNRKTRLGCRRKKKYIVQIYERSTKRTFCPANVIEHVDCHLHCPKHSNLERLIFFL